MLCVCINIILSLFKNSTPPELLMTPYIIASGFTCGYNHSSPSGLFFLTHILVPQKKSRRDLTLLALHVCRASNKLVTPTTAWLNDPGMFKNSTPPWLLITPYIIASGFTCGYNHSSPSGFYFKPIF